MTQSSLASSFIDVGKGYYYRYYDISRVTIHHMAGVMSAADCACYHRDSGVQASANYYIGNDGDIVCGLQEEVGPWTSSDWYNDNMAITMEVSNSYAGGNWPISDAAWNSMIKLCADICKRYGITPSYTGDTGGSFTEHRMFAATACPGEYIHSRMDQIVRDVKTAMNGGSNLSWPVQSYQPNVTDAQKWRMLKQADGSYEIVSVANGMALDVYGAGSANYTVVQAYKRNNTKAQRWKIERATTAPDGKTKYNPPDWAPVTLSPLCAPKMKLDLYGAYTENGGKIQIYQPNLTNAQNWAMMDNGDGTFTFVNVASGKALDLVGAGK